jgi:Gas vesicle synthesis protein GvpL/GvpF
VAELSAGVRLYGIVSAQEADGRQMPDGACIVPFRDLAAITTECSPGEAFSWRRTPAPPNLDAYRALIEAVFEQCSIVPAPPGIIFRSRQAIVRWLELHYVALSDAHAFIDGRAVGRVHVERRAPSLEGANLRHERLAGEAVAREVFRSLAGHAVTWTPISGVGVPGATGEYPAVQPTTAPTGEQVASEGSQASFLIDRAHWSDFEAAVAEENRRDAALGVWVSGPWPPYDFVRLQFGG